MIPTAPSGRKRKSPRRHRRRKVAEVLLEASDLYNPKDRDSLKQKYTQYLSAWPREATGINSHAQSSQSNSHVDKPHYQPHPPPSPRSNARSTFQPQPSTPKQQELEFGTPLSEAQPWRTLPKEEGLTSQHPNFFKPHAPGQRDQWPRRLQPVSQPIDSQLIDEESALSKPFLRQEPLTSVRRNDAYVDEYRQDPQCAPKNLIPRTEYMNGLNRPSAMILPVPLVANLPTQSQLQMPGYMPPIVLMPRRSSWVKSTFSDFQQGIVGSDGRFEIISDTTSPVCMSSVIMSSQIRQSNETHLLHMKELEELEELKAAKLAQQFEMFLKEKEKIKEEDDLEQEEVDKIALELKENQEEREELIKKRAELEKERAKAENEEQLQLLEESLFDVTSQEKVLNVKKGELRAQKSAAVARQLQIQQRCQDLEVEQSQFDCEEGFDRMKEEIQTEHAISMRRLRRPLSSVGACNTPGALRELWKHNLALAKTKLKDNPCFQPIRVDLLSLEVAEYSSMSFLSKPSRLVFCDRNGWVYLFLLGDAYTSASDPVSLEPNMLWKKQKLKRSDNNSIVSIASWRNFIAIASRSVLCLLDDLGESVLKIEIEGDEDPLLLMDENYLVVGLSDKRLLFCNLEKKQMKMIKVRAKPRLLKLTSSSMSSVLSDGSMVTVELRNGLRTTYVEQSELVLPPDVLSVMACGSAVILRTPTELSLLREGGCINLWRQKQHWKPLFWSMNKVELLLIASSCTTAKALLLTYKM